MVIPKQMAHDGPREETRGKPWAFLHLQIRASPPPPAGASRQSMVPSLNQQMETNTVNNINQDKTKCRTARLFSRGCGIY